MHNLPASGLLSGLLWDHFSHTALLGFPGGRTCVLHCLSGDQLLKTLGVRHGICQVQHRNASLEGTEVSLLDGVREYWGSRSRTWSSKTQGRQSISLLQAMHKAHGCLPFGEAHRCCTALVCWRCRVTQAHPCMSRHSGPGACSTRGDQKEIRE